MRDKVKKASKALYLLRMPNISEICWYVVQRNEALKREVYHHNTTWGTKKGAPAWTKVPLSTQQMRVKHTVDRKICTFCSVAIGASLWKMQRFGSHVMTALSHEACTAGQLVPV